MLYGRRLTEIHYKLRGDEKKELNKFTLRMRMNLREKLEKKLMK
jgi:hypothetical protein